MSQIEKHPQRYPKHASDKGQVWGGECNTTRCDNDPAIWFNNQTFGFYCPRCADGINRFNRAHPICTAAEGQLTIAEMNLAHAVHTAAYRS